MKSTDKKQHYGVAVREDGGISITKPRATEEAALRLAESREGVRHFTVEATDAAEARRLAMNPGEPSATELAEQAAEDKGPKPSAIAQRLAAPRWWAIAYDASGKASLSGPHGEGDEAIPEAQAAADRLVTDEPGVLEGSQFIVEARSKRDAQAVAEQMSGEATPLEPVRVSPGTRKPSVRVYGTEPVVVDTYFVMGTGTVHTDPECRFVRGREGVSVFAYEGDLVAEIMAGETVRTVGENSYNARDYCRFCAVVKPEKVAV